jgi:hypothetical protein
MPEKNVIFAVRLSGPASAQILRDRTWSSFDFYTCDADLEDELIRALGVDTVLEVLATQGDLGRFRIFQRQPEWEERSNEEQLRRWLGTTAHRKISYAELLVNALALHRVPLPLERLLAYVAAR